MPGESGGPVVATLVCHHHPLRTRLRVQRAPGIPHALCWAKGSCTTRAHRAAGSRSRILATDVIARSGATKQSTLLFAALTMDCFASLAMTVLATELAVCKLNPNTGPLP